MEDLKLIIYKIINNSKILIIVTITGRPNSHCTLSPTPVCIRIRIVLELSQKSEAVGWLCLLVTVWTPICKIKLPILAPVGLVLLAKVLSTVESLITL